MALLLSTQLALERCPHCQVDRPNLTFVKQYQPESFDGTTRFWRIYICQRCAGLVSGESFTGWDGMARRIFPSSESVSEDVPDRARSYLEQSVGSLSVPAGAVMLAASSVDAMLKAKGLKDGSLYTRIDAAAKQHLITEDMAKWAHDVRLDANDQRHADEEAPLPTGEDARRCVDFAMALGQFLFVLPARVQRGLKGENGK